MNSDWKWFGHAGHFICAHDCQFHLATQVGKYLISSVGDYRPNYKRKGDRLPEAEEIGYGRKYETFVFKVSKGTCKCGCGLPLINLSEIDTLSANDAMTARKNHMSLCNKYEELKGGSK